MAAERKMFRLDKLSPEVREQVESEIQRRVAEDRLRQLVSGNKRLIQAVCDVEDQGGEALDVIEECIRPLGEDAKPPRKGADG